MAAFLLASRPKYWPWLSDILCIEVTMQSVQIHRASTHRSAGHWPMEQASGSLTLDFDTRHRRRIRLTADQGEDLLLDLPHAVAMAHGDGLQLEDGRWFKVQAAPELIIEVRHKDR